jgi:hypothetical protein
MIDSCKKDTHNTPETYVVKAMIVYPDVSIGGIKMESTMKLQLKNKENVVHAMLLPLYLQYLYPIDFFLRGENQNQK